MRPRVPWNRALKVIDGIYHRMACVSYIEFRKKWYVGRPSIKGVPSLPSQPTYSRIWKFYQRENGLRTLRNKRLVEWILFQFGKRTLNPDSPRDELHRQAVKLMASQGLVMISESRFYRALSEASRKFKDEDCENRIDRLGESLGVSLRDRPILMRWNAASELLRFPPAAIGRANLPKMVEEYRIFRDISSALARNDLDPRILLAHPDCDRQFQSIERHSPSVMRRWEQRRMLEALPFYLAGRLRDGIDAILLCLVRKARLLQSRMSEEAEEDRREESMALLERTGRHFQALQVAIGEALASGSPQPLVPFRGTLSRLSKDSASALDRNRLYHLIGSRGAYTRKFAHRLVGIQFQGHDQHARVIVEVLQEVLKFEPFEKPVPEHCVEKLAFLQIPHSLMIQRRVFEPIVVITLADCLWSSRISAELSRRFSNIWPSIPNYQTKIDTAKWIGHRRQLFHKAWRTFKTLAREDELVKDGRLNIRRLPKQKSQQSEIQHRKRHASMVSEFKVIPITEVVLKVHRVTGFLDDFILHQTSTHQFTNEERLRLVSGILIAEGMNLNIGTFQLL